jgi:hypothetical protein
VTEEDLPRIDSAKIMEEIGARVAERKAAGGYTAEEVREIAAMELELREREGYGEESDRLISWLHANWEATSAVDAEGQGSSPLKALVKKILRAALSPLARLMLGKQNQINARLVQLLSGSLPTLRDNLGDVENRSDQRLAALEKEMRRLSEEVKKLEERQGR